MDKALFIPNLFALGLSACATAGNHEAIGSRANTVADLVCSDPKVLAEKINMDQCTAYYTDIYHDGAACQGLNNEGCAKTLREMELALLVPKFKPR